MNSFNNDFCKKLLFCISNYILAMSYAGAQELRPALAYGTNDQFTAKSRP